MRNIAYDPNLVLHLPLTELDGAELMSRDAYGHVCTISGASWSPKGRHFDGVDDFASLPTNRPCFNISAITLEVWLKLLSNNSLYDAIIATNTDKYGLDFPTEASNQVRFFTDGATGFVAGTNNNALNLGEYYHIAGTYEQATGLILYANGNIVATAASKGDVKAFTGTITLGGKGSAAYNLNGLIGEVRIYNRALTAMEIQHNYLATKPRYM